MAQVVTSLAFIFIYVIVAEAGGCSVSDGRFQNTMRNEGLVDPVQDDYDWFECGYGDTWVSSFHAQRPQVVEDGQPMTRLSVDGTLCCGIFKGCTIRWQ